MTLYTYDPGDVEVIVGTVACFGYASGAMVRVEPNSDRANPYRGTQGEQSRAIVRDQSGRITVRLAATSPANDLLDAQSKVDFATASGEVFILVRDLSGRGLHEGEDAYLVREPSRDYSDEVGELEWVFECPKLRSFQGGN